MQNKEFANKVVEAIWMLVNAFRAEATGIELLASALYVLYGYHKQYPVVNDEYLFECAEDRILNELRSGLPIYRHGKNTNLNFLYSFLSKVDTQEYEKNYPYILACLFENFALAGGKQIGEFVTPSEINALISFFIKREHCRSVYDPFCGTSSILPYLREDYDCGYIGQDIFFHAALLSRVMVEACGGSYVDIINSDSIANWNSNHYDAVATCHPWGLKYSNSIHGSKYGCEGAVVDNAFQKNSANLCIILVPTSICSSLKYTCLFESWVDFENKLDTVASLPANLIYGSSIPTTLLVFKKNRSENDPVRMLRLEEYYKEGTNHKRVFDIERFLKLDMNVDEGDCSLVDTEDIGNLDFNLNPRLYKHLEMDSGQKKVGLNEVLNFQFCASSKLSEYHNLILPKQLTQGFINVLLNENTYSEDEAELGKKRELKYCSGEGKFLLSCYKEVNRQSYYALHTDSKDFYYPSSVKVFKINEDLVIPEYIVYKLQTDYVLKYLNTSLSRSRFAPIVIDSLERQKEIVEKLKQEYNEKQRAEREADEQRLGIKRSISDLEHMLGTPQFKINQIIARLERMTPEAANYMTTVKSLRDNMEYMNRLIRFTNAKIDPNAFNMKEGNLSTFMNEYANGWRNYGGSYFELSIVDGLNGEGSVLFDKTMLTVMLDAILSNAVRHGFHKDKDYTDNNRVEISLSPVAYGDDAYALVKVANNGDPMPDNFSMEDYISRGRFSASTGRSGLGGYHVHQITKGHVGYLYLDSNNVWNMVVEILLPLHFVKVEDLNEYEHGQECI